MLLKSILAIALAVLSVSVFAEIPAGAFDAVGTFRSSLVDTALSVITTLAPFWAIYMLGKKMGFIDDDKGRGRRAGSSVRSSSVRSGGSSGVSSGSRAGSYRGRRRVRRRASDGSFSGSGSGSGNARAFIRFNEKASNKNSNRKFR